MSSLQLQPSPVSILGDHVQSDLHACSTGRVLHNLNSLTWRTREHGQRRNYGVGRNNGVIRYLSAVLYYCELSLVQREVNLIQTNRHPIKTNNDTILSNLNVVPNSCGFDDTVCADMNMVTDFHRVIIEISTICFVWGPRYEIYHWDDTVEIYRHTSLHIPHPQDNIFPAR